MEQGKHSLRPRIASTTKPMKAPLDYLAEQFFLQTKQILTEINLHLIISGS